MDPNRPPAQMEEVGSPEGSDHPDSASDESGKLFDEIIGLMEHYKQNVFGSETLPNFTSIIELLLVTRRNSGEYFVMRLVAKILESLFELVATAGESRVKGLHKEMYLLVLKTLRNPRVYGVKLITSQIERDTSPSQQGCWNQTSSSTVTSRRPTGGHQPYQFPSKPHAISRRILQRCLQRLAAESPQRLQHDHQQLWQCGKTFPPQRLLKDHLRRVHPNTPFWDCFT